MDNLSAQFLRVMSIINLNLRLFSIGINTEKAPRRSSTVLIVLGSAVYIVYLVKCISETSYLSTASEMVFHIPWMLQYNLKSANMLLQYESARDFLYWAKEIFNATHPMPYVDAMLKETQRKGLKYAKTIVSWNIVFWKSPVILYYIEGLFTDKVLFLTLTDNDAELPMSVQWSNWVIQFFNGLLINSIALGYNAFVFLWCICLIYRLKVVSGLLTELQKQPNDNSWTRTILLECHRIYVETLVWKNRMESYVSLVGAIEMGTSIIMVCFLLYLCLGSETRSTAAFVIMGTAVYQTAMFCYLGEQFGTEAQNFRMQLCNLDWLDFDLETKKLFHMMLVGATTDKMCKIGSLKINLESFSKFLNVSFSFCAVIQGYSTSHR